MDHELLQTRSGTAEDPVLGNVHAGHANTDINNAATLFLNAKPRLRAIAYRYLRSTSEAEDVVQDVWLRWQETDRTVVRNPTAFLATTTARLAINVTQSARKKRVVLAGPWFPEPVEQSAGPEPEAEQCEAVERAVLILLETLSATERAAYVLREAFGYPYRQISETLNLDAAHARQLVRRANKKISAGGRRPVSRSTHLRLVEAFKGAARAGNLTELEDLLAEDMGQLVAGQSWWVNRRQG